MIAARLRSAVPAVLPLWAWLGLDIARSRERRMLRTLDDRRLPDIGLSRAEVGRACAR